MCQDQLRSCPRLPEPSGGGDRLLGRLAEVFQHVITLEGARVLTGSKHHITPRETPGTRGDAVTWA